MAKKMKMEWWTTTQDAVNNALAFIQGTRPDSKEPLLITIQEYKETRSQKQNALVWVINTQVAEQTGYTKDEVHNKFKRLFAVNIWVRDDKGYSEMYHTVQALTDENQKHILSREIVELTRTSNFSTEQCAEYLNEVINYCNDKGLNLYLKKDDYSLFR